MHAFETNHTDIITYLLEETTLIRKILDTSKLQGSSAGFIIYTHSNGESSERREAKGFLVFFRRIANKMVEMKERNKEIADFLESIPEWTEYYEHELLVVN